MAADELMHREVGLGEARSTPYGFCHFLNAECGRG
jgi:hypothetical protein